MPKAHISSIEGQVAQQVRSRGALIEQILRIRASTLKRFQPNPGLARRVQWAGSKPAEPLTGGSATIINNSRQRITDMKINRWCVAVAMAAITSLGLTQSLAQDNQGPPPGGRRNFDPAQFQQRRLERIKEQMDVTDDTEWKALQPLIQKVMDARMATMSGMGRGMFGPPRRGGGADNAQSDQGPRGRGMFGAASPEAEALQKAIDAKAPKAEIKAALAKYVEARKAKQAELESAQEALRKVLTTRQEAVATLEGLL